MTKQQNYSRRVKRLKFILPLVALALLLAIVLLGEQEIEVADLPFDYQKIELTRKGPLMREPELRGRNSAGTPYEVVAELARPDPNNENIVYLQDVKGVLLSPDNTETRRMTAPNGVLQRQNDQLYLTGGVRLTDWRGFEMTSPTMNIDFRTEIATTQSEVVAAQENSRIVAGSMNANAVNETIYFFNGATTTHIPPQNKTQDKTQSSSSPDTKEAGFQTDPSAPIVTSAQDLSLNQKTLLAIYQGGVDTVQGPMSLRSARLALTFNEQKELQTLRAEQNVELRDTDGTIARGDWAEHHIDSGEIFMGGAQGSEVTLIDGGNILRGTSLRVDTATGKAILTGGTEAENSQRVRGIFTPGQ
ncbi:MAG: LPS export ABC transporter periplasmic protein LptC [Parvibaculales bacterium]